MPFVLWCAVIAGFEALGVSEIVLRGPLGVVEHLFTQDSASDNRAQLLAALAETLPYTLLGMLAGLAVALVLAVATTVWRGLGHSLLPLALISQSMPLVALTPLVVLVFGRGTAAILVVTVSVTFFPAFVTIAQGLALVLAVVVLNFVLVHAAPGDPVETIAGASGGMDEKLQAELRAMYGLDQPLPVQLGIYLGKVVRGDLGYSYFFNLPVSDLILERVPATLLLVLTSVLTAFLIGTALGVLSSRKPNGWLSQLINVMSLVGFAAPVFWMGMLLIILLASIFPVFPVSGMRGIESSGLGWADVVDVLHHLVLPAFTLGLVYLAQYSRLSRAAMLDVLGADYIRTARAKGLPERLVLYKHALRNAVLPVVTILGLQFGNVLAGAIVVETVFNWPGLGRLAFESVLRRDYPTILGVLLFSSIVVIVMNQVTDLCYRLIDPRIKTS